ncbi:phosphoenolpyruvate phosphomutase [Nitratiruptor sp. YY08-26]|uniref:phosphoenolpyruvate mutase n=1 Tax=unclassified Nitratiruptor TaxID=2624044 RepID=UPI001915E4AC|nr:MULTISPECIES: phosphoenolpyruvate mutase [unclassified Nitratiruptor]BCD62068.1 phosphoenolpyruvate phosphomutase [Nitratiruptor sp. YY08-13]BCD66004.1 phosphoenolpyruvate phosphomutase [Nitratiruptor sp. YY08-26]
MMKKVYVGMIADLLHAGHIRVLKEAAKYGEVIVGLYTLKACGEINDIPYLDYEKRKEVLENLSLVKKVIPQNSASYKENLLNLKPDYVVHGDDWIYNHQKKYRKEVIEILEKWGGKLIEIPYSSDINDIQIKEQMRKLGITTTARLGRLKKLLEAKPLLKIMEVHNALSGLIVENIKEISEDGEMLIYDGMWSSSLTDSTSRGKPDIEAVDTTARLTTINEIFEVTTKPLIYDADTGGKPEHFKFTVKNLERIGVSAVIIEDKTGLKKNSLFGTEVPQTQDSIENFCYKIQVGKESQITKDFMIIARIESLILGKGLNDALKRAFAYIDAGADGIMIHSRNKEPSEIIEFVKQFRKKDLYTPIVVVPTSFNSVTTDEFEKMGVNIVIYANHMLRAAYPCMVKVAKSILKHKRSLEAEPYCMPIKEILNLIPGTK